MTPLETLTLTLTPTSILNPRLPYPTRLILPTRSPTQKVAAFPISSPPQQKSPEAAAVELYCDARARGLLVDPNLTSDVMLWYAQNGKSDCARELWDELIHSSFRPNLDLITSLMVAHAKMRKPDEALRIFRETAARDFGFGLREFYSSAISRSGEAGELQLMEKLLLEMKSRGIRMDGSTANDVVKHYANFGSLDEMEDAHDRLKNWRVAIEEEGVRASARAYLRRGKMYRLGEFLRGIGLGRRNIGNLPWNLLLLSYASSFKMKSLQKEFLRMIEAGFSPDLVTFNVRMLAFSRMSMLWDLHLSIEHMKREGVAPDLVTYGCIVDAYVERRLGKNLSFALENMGGDVDGGVPCVLTDSLVFEGFGKGDFHMYAEQVLESKRDKFGGWSYGKLIRAYLRRTYRSNQVFWNY